MKKRLTVRSIRQLTKDDLLFLLKKNDFDILIELNKTEFGFFSFLKNRTYKKQNEEQILEIVVKLLSQACSVKGQQKKPHLNRFFRVLKDSLEFLYDDIPRIINTCFTKNRGINVVSFMSQYMSLLEAAMRKDFFPCTRIVEEIFPSLENYMNRLREKRLKNMDEAEKSFGNLKRQVELYEDPEKNSEEEDDDEISQFRSMSLVPKDNEIVNYEVAHVPQNIIDKPYKSVEHYLSVHYRLMREDMLRSFRECVNSYLSFSGHDAFSVNKNMYYEKVKVISIPEYSIDGIVYTIHVKSSKAVDLSEKDLKPGSMLFLSDNSFQSVIFATIKQFPSSTTGKTKEFKLKIKLEDDSFNSSLRDDSTYEMIQPPAYFECYKHVLSGIKEFSENNFPLSDIITYFDFDDTVPPYLEGKFCLHEDCGSSTKHDSSHHCKNFNPLNNDEWPSSKDLKLDDQQYIAFKTAITKKVAVLQGPPGTGKTYIGKKVLKALLENTHISDKDNTDKAQNSPIVVCCLTNHALDQFLEGIIKEGITNNVVRLGGQSKSEILEPHVLNNMIYAVREYKLRQSVGDESKKSLDLVKNIANVVLQQNIITYYEPQYFEILALSSEINENIYSLSMCKDKYLEDTALNDIIGSKFKDILRNTPGQLKKSLSAGVLEWLACSRSKDLYDKCQKYFLSFKKLDIQHHPSSENLWHLSGQKRYELFYLWRKRCLDVLSQSLKEKIEKYKELMKFNLKSVDGVKLEILKGASVIGVTTTGAGKYKELIKYSKPRIIIIEEAAQVLEAHIIASLVPSIQHLILIGDHEQLRPLPTNHDLSENYNLKISLFERLFRNGAPSATLVCQHRMRPCIAELLVPRPYPNYTSFENVYKYEEIRGVQSSVFFFNHSHPEGSNSSGTSASNMFEAQMIACLARYFVVQSYPLKEITIIAAYAAQVVLILEKLREVNLSEIHVTTVDNFQGEENEIILISFVRSNPTSIGFLKESNRLCVALSRAKKGMFCFGNFDLFASKNDLWKDIIDKARLKNMLGDSLVLKCHKHEYFHTSKSHEDILAFVINGCPELCGFLLPCNHKCTSTCHFKDPKHLRYLCREPCERMIDENRVCPRLCYERCKRAKRKQIELPCGHLGYATDAFCLKEIQKILPCGHIITIPCYTDYEEYKCEAPATIKLSCGHTKTVSCYEQAENISIVCTDLRPETGACGHVVNVPCSLHLDEIDLIPFCDKSCGAFLDCGHVCVSLCRICFDTGIHGFCREKCELILSCGHQCQGFCNSPCPPCKLKCFCECVHHTKCINMCLRACVKCVKPCPRVCEHTSCSKTCHEKCDVKPCYEPCLKTLECGHKCIGLCGDPCPYMCCICNKDDFKSGLYVELECEDIIEVNELSEHIENCLLSFEWPCCPKCSKVIRKSVRYKESLLEAKEICIKSYDTSEVLSEIEYLVESMYGEDFIVPAQFLPIHLKITHILKKQSPQSDSLIVLKNCIVLLKKLFSISQKLVAMCEEKYQSRFDTLLLWIFQHLTSASFQQLKELKLAVTELVQNVSQ